MLSPCALRCGYPLVPRFDRRRAQFWKCIADDRRAPALPSVPPCSLVLKVFYQLKNASRRFARADRPTNAANKGVRFQKCATDGPRWFISDDIFAHGAFVAAACAKDSKASTVDMRLRSQAQLLRNALIQKPSERSPPSNVTSGNQPRKSSNALSMFIGLTRRDLLQGCVWKAAHWPQLMLSFRRVLRKKRPCL